MANWARAHVKGRFLSSSNWFGYIFCRFWSVDPKYLYRDWAGFVYFPLNVVTLGYPSLTYFVCPSVQLALCISCSLVQYCYTYMKKRHLKESYFRTASSYHCSLLCSLTCNSIYVANWNVGVMSIWSCFLSVTSGHPVRRTLAFEERRQHENVLSFNMNAWTRWHLHYFRSVLHFCFWWG